jgi:hypothetical protein
MPKCASFSAFWVEGKGTAQRRLYRGKTEPSEQDRRPPGLTPSRQSPPGPAGLDVRPFSQPRQDISQIAPNHRNAVVKPDASVTMDDQISVDLLV